MTNQRRKGEHVWIEREIHVVRGVLRRRLSRLSSGRASPQAVPGEIFGVFSDPQTTASRDQSLRRQTDRGTQGTVVEFIAARHYEKLGIADSFKFSVHPGGHVFEIESIFRFLDKHLGK